MSLQTEIGLLKKELDKIEDKHLINAIKELIKFSYQKREEELLKPFTNEQLINRTKQSEKDIKEGRVMTLNASRKASKKW